MAKYLCVAAFALLFVGEALCDLELTPLNDAVLVGDTLVLRCSAATGGNPRIMWTEFTTDEAGRVISDQRIIIPSHPNAHRYSIEGTGNVYDLRISPAEIIDGGRYLCQDINGASPGLYRGSAELTVLASHPVCQEFSTVSGAVVEGRYYTTECEVSYKGGFEPNMTWTGPGTFDRSESTTETEVWSMSAFTAHRDHEGENFECQTRFRLPPNVPAEGATNTPGYTHLFTGVTLVVNWHPQNMLAVPIKETYFVGDTITCSADSKPTSTYRWTNVATQETFPPSPIFTVTENMQGQTSVVRCNAIVLLDGSLYTSDLFLNVTVPPGTTTGPPTTIITTSPVPPDQPCKDLSGRWRATNPNATLCVEIDRKGNLITLLRNGSDQYFVPGNGKTQIGDYRHIGFTSIWPNGQGGVGGFTGECHNCFGNEVILMSGLSRNKAQAPQCGDSSGTHFTNLYVLTRNGDVCINPQSKVYRPSPAHIKHFQISEDKIVR